MKYRTTCPHCASVFRLGADQLDAAQGWAQCGVCGGAFDARASLLMEDGSPLPAASEREAAVAPETVASPEPVPADTPAPAAAEAPASPGADGAPPAAERPVGIARREVASDLTSIIIIDPDIPVPDDFGPLPEIPPAGSAGMPLMYPRPYSREPATAAAPPAAAVEYATHPSAPLHPSAEQPVWHTARAPRRTQSWAWSVASVLLLVALLAQGAYFLRDTLASQLPQSRPGLEHMCALLGCTLSLPKNLARLQIVGSDLETEAGGRLRLTLTLGNRDNHAQAWPVLVLTLTDQRNHPLARRSFAPSEYLADPARIAAGVPPRSEQPLTLPLAVHDLKPMGFDLQLVY